MGIGDIKIKWISGGGFRVGLEITIAEMNVFPDESNPNRLIVTEVQIWWRASSRIAIDTEIMNLAQLKIIAESIDVFAPLLERLTEPDVGKIFPYNERARELADTLATFQK